jgi:hypothetical protein
MGMMRARRVSASASARFEREGELLAQQRKDIVTRNECFSKEGLKEVELEVEVKAG